MLILVKGSDGARHLYRLEHGRASRVPGVNLLDNALEQQAVPRDPLSGFDEQRLEAAIVVPFARGGACALNEVAERRVAPAKFALGRFGPFEIEDVGGIQRRKVVELVGRVTVSSGLCTRRRFVRTRLTCLSMTFAQCSGALYPLTGCRLALRSCRKASLAGRMASMLPNISLASNRGMISVSLLRAKSRSGCA